MAVARDESRPVLTGIQMRFEGDSVTMSSTDRFRLSRYTMRMGALRSATSETRLIASSSACLSMTTWMG